MLSSIATGFEAGFDQVTRSISRLGNDCGLILVRNKHL
jgi:hypothetical protein